MVGVTYWLDVGWPEAPWYYALGTLLFTWGLYSASITLDEISSGMDDVEYRASIKWVEPVSVRKYIWATLGIKRFPRPYWAIPVILVKLIGMQTVKNADHDFTPLTINLLFAIAAVFLLAIIYYPYLALLVRKYVEIWSTGHISVLQDMKRVLYGPDEILSANIFEIREDDRKRRILSVHLTSYRHIFLGLPINLDEGKFEEVFAHLNVPFHGVVSLSEWPSEKILEKYETEGGAE